MKQEGRAGLSYSLKVTETPKTKIKDEYGLRKGIQSGLKKGLVFRIHKRKNNPVEKWTKGNEQAKHKEETEQ